MIFRELAIAGAYLLEVERFEDERGSFARTFCRRELEAHGLDPTIAQCSVSTNKRRGTVRGLHFQAEPHGEAKLIRCTHGRIFDVLVDLRPESPTFLRTASAVLSREATNAVFAPRGCAHGFQTLEDDSEVFYQISTFYEPGAGRGYRYDDPTFGIAWPEPVTVISEKDLALPYFSRGEA